MMHTFTWVERFLLFLLSVLVSLFRGEQFFTLILAALALKVKLFKMINLSKEYIAHPMQSMGVLNLRWHYVV